MKRFVASFIAVLCCMVMNAQTTFEVGGINYSVNGENTVEVVKKNSNYTGDVVIPSTVTFDDIPYSVTGIGKLAFEICDNMSSVTIPESVTSIGDYAFYCCESLTSITIPKSVTSIGISLFEYCNSLASITVAAENTVYDSRNNCNAIIETASNKLHCGCMNTVIPNTVTSIGNDSFCNCVGMTAITIPELVTSIGDNAFFGCWAMTCIYVLATDPPFLGEDAFRKVPKNIPVYVPDVSAYNSWSEFFSNLRPISDVRQAKKNSIEAINSAIEGVTDEDILAFANQTITDINDLIISKESVESIAALALAKINAWKDIDAAIEGVTDEDILAVANQAKKDIVAAATEDINTIKEQALAKINAWNAIDAAIEGVTDEDILAVANQAKKDIVAAATEDINSIKEQALADLAIPVKYYNSGKDNALGALGTPQTNCPAVKVMKGDKVVILYAPDKVEMIKVSENK